MNSESIERSYNQNELPPEGEIFKVPPTEHYDHEKYGAQTALVKAARETKYLYEKRKIPERKTQSDGLGTKVEIFDLASKALPEGMRVWEDVVIDGFAAVLDDFGVSGITPADIAR